MRAAITVLPGDGIGPEVVAQATRVLAAVGERWGHVFTLRDALIGGAAIDKTGTALPPETLAIARETDAVLLGAVGGPKWDDPRGKVRPEQGLLAIRRLFLRRNALIEDMRGGPPVAHIPSRVTRLCYNLGHASAFFGLNRPLWAHRAQAVRLDATICPKNRESSAAKWESAVHHSSTRS